MGIFGPKYKSSTDEELMLLLRDRDSKAFSELYDRYSGRLINYFFRMLWKDREKAEDFTQDIFAKLIDKPELYKEGRSFKTWLFSIANNMCKNEYRKQENRKTSPHEMPHDFATASTDDPQKKIDLDSFHGALQIALDELEDNKKQAFILRYKYDLSIKEIGEVMECSDGTVKSRLFYTLKNLNEKLKTYEGVRLSIYLAAICEGLKTWF